MYHEYKLIFLKIIQSKYMIYTLFVILASFSTYYIIYNTKKNNLERQKLLLSHVKSMKDIFDSNLDEWSNYYTGVLNNLATDNDISSLVAHKQRDELYDIMYNVFLDMQAEEPSLKTMHFYSSDGSMFLPVQDKESFDNTLSSDRPLIELVNEKAVSTSGFQSCPFGGVFRIVVPIIYDESAIGALEIGFDPNLIAKSLDKSATSEKFQYLLHKNSVKKLRAESKMSPVAIDDTYFINQLNNSFTLDFLEHVLDSDTDKGAIIEQGENQYLISKIAVIHGTKGEELGEMIGYYDFTIDNQKYRFNIVQTYLKVFIVFFIFLIILILIQKRRY